MKIAIGISRILVGIVFIFSGFVKAIDPLGSTYKFTDYFNAFGMEWLTPTAFALAIALSAVEFLAGISLLFNLQIKMGVWLSFLFMLFFTPLTLVLAITNPVSDCGCFGDALIMTNWQTFGKNAVLIVLAALLFWKRNQLTANLKPTFQWATLAAFTIFIIAFEFYNYKNLPLIDFRPYTVGTHIPDQMIIPEGAPKDSSITYLYYQKNGVVKEFTMENYPWQDSTWKWVETKDVLIRKGYEPPIHNLSITPLLTDSDQEKTDLLDVILQKQSPIIWIVAYDLQITNHKAWLAISQWIKNNNIKIPIYVLTASDSDRAAQINELIGTTLNFYSTDAITLKTIIRANPGVLILNKGTIEGKWSYGNLPEKQDFEKFMELKPD